VDISEGIRQGYPYAEDIWIEKELFRRGRNMGRPLIGITTNHSDREKEVRLSRYYVEAVAAAGGLPVLLPPVREQEIITDYLERIDGLLLSGGGDIDPLIYGEDPLPENGRLDPLRDNFELELVKRALERELSILGICKGCQVLNIAFGGSLYQDLYRQKSAVLKHVQEAPRWYPTHRVRIEADSHLYRIVRQELIEVNSIHHQAIKEVSPCFKVAAYSADGVIEAIEKKEGAFVLGVQWHPECLWQDSKENFNIFKEFIEQCRE
jgi:putative glutamine amidotransferase